MSEGAPIEGVFAALPTPFDEHRAVDVRALDHLVDYLLERELHGFALLTEAAEDALLSPEERRLLLKSISARVKGRRGLLVAISAPATHEAVELVRVAEGKGASAILLSPPRLPGFGYRELYRHLDRVIRSTALPVLLLARPGNVLRSLSPEEMTTLFEHPQLRGVVAPHAGGPALEGWAKRFRGRPASVLGGCSLALTRTMRAGGHGAVCGVAVVAASQAASVWSAFVSGQQGDAERLESKTAVVVEALGPPLVTDSKDGVQKLATKIAKRPLEAAALPPSYPFALIKETLRLQGHPIRPDVRPPYEAVRPEVSERLKITLQSGGVLP